MAPDSLACANEAFLRSVLFKLASVKLAPVNFARVSRARCSTAPDRSAPDKSASVKSLRLSAARGNAQPGQDFDLPDRKSLSPAAHDRLDPVFTSNPSTRAHSSPAGTLKGRCDIMRPVPACRSDRIFARFGLCAKDRPR